MSALLGCGSGGTPPPTNSNSAPFIATQPADASAEVGQTATFTVIAQGSTPLQYQWSRNGNPIPSAISSSYTTPNLDSADLGDTFSVVVSNGFGQVSSRSASLSLGPRSPLPGDLRFQQDAAATTAPGYGGINNGTLVYPSSTSQVNGWGTPLSMGPGCIGATSQGPSACSWIWFTFGRANLTGIGISYTNQPASDLDWFISQLTDSEVINGVAIDQNFDSAGFSVVGRNDASGFACQKQTVSLANLASALSTAGAAGAVPTAISPDSGNVTFYACTWEADSFKYDVQLQLATSSTVASAADDLAQAGYIITASGGSGDDLFFVGTRVQGDAVPRPVLVIQAGESPQPLADGGYSPVAVGADSNGNVLFFIGER
ncbi:MAG: hypothetical protein WAM85_00205 [Terracidiphilus sp.]